MKHILLSIGLLLCAVDSFGTDIVGSLDLSFNSDGIVTTDIGTNSVDIANASAVQPDGNIVVVGSSAGNVAIARYTIEGDLDTTFNSTGIITWTIPTTSASVATGVAIQNDGKIVVVGNCTVSSVNKYFIARFLPNGLLDSSSNDSDTPFNTTSGYVINLIGTTSCFINAVTLQKADQKIVIAGTTTSSSTNSIVVARYSTNGTLDTSGFNTSSGYNSVLHPGTTNIANAVVIDSNGKIVIAGQSDTKMIVARFTSAGILDTTFKSLLIAGTTGYNLQSLAGSPTIAYGLGFQANGDIIVCGSTTVSSSLSAFVARFHGAANGILYSAGQIDLLQFGTGTIKPGYNTNKFGGTSAVAYGLAVQANNDIVICGSTVQSGVTDFVVASYLANGSALDTTTFNPSNGYTITNVGTPATGRSLTMQSNGRFIIAGTVQGTSSTDFGVARYSGYADVQGCMDVTYPAALIGVDLPGFATYPTDSVAADEPEVIALQPLSDDSVFVVTSTGFGTATQLVQLQSDGSVAASSFAIAQTNPQDVIVDSTGRAIVIGTTAGNQGWINRYTVTAGTPGSFAQDPAFNSGDLVMSSQSSSFRRVGEQKAGRIITIGQASSSANGLLIAYNEFGELAISSTGVGFGTGGPADFTGFITQTTATFCDVLIDANDGIYIAFTDASTIKIAKYLANGSGLDTTFGTTLHGIVDTSWAVGSYGLPAITFDVSGNIIIAAINSSTGDIACKRYATLSDGTTTASGTITHATSLMTTPILTKLQCDTNDCLVCTGYDANDFFIARLVLASSTYSLDTTFAPYSSSPGILKTTYNDANPTNTTSLSRPYRKSNSVGIVPSGAILFGGYEFITSSQTVSVVGQVVGNTGFGQVARYAGANIIGVIDTSFGTDGALKLALSLFDFDKQQPKAMRVFDAGANAGKILMALDSSLLDSGTHTVLARLNSDYSLDTTFGTSILGVHTGKITLSGFTNPKNIMVDVDGNIYVVGDNASGSQLSKIASDGSSILWTAATHVTLGDSVCQQASGRILLCGYDSSYHSDAGSGVIVAYNPSTGDLDTSFNAGAENPGAPGYWYTGLSYPITSMSIGATASVYADKIYFSYNNSSHVALVDCLLENGSALNPSFTFGTGLENVYSNRICMQLDVHGKIVLVVGTQYHLAAARYNQDGTDDIDVTVVSRSSAFPVLENILSLSDGTTLILATSESHELIVSQLTPAFVLDPNFNPDGSLPGSLQTAVSPMVDFYGIDVIATEGIIVCGDNNQTTSSALPYMTKIINNVVITKVAQNATETPTAGVLDTTFNAAGTNAGFMNLHTELSTITEHNFTTPAVAKVVLQNSDGSYFIAANDPDGFGGYITKMTQDDIQDTTFASATNNILTVTMSEAIAAMMIDQAGYLVVVGTFGFIQQYNATTGVATSWHATMNIGKGWGVAQQSNGRYIVAGKKNGSGALIAYNSVTGAVDTTFGVNGLYIAPDFTMPINAIVVDEQDNIYFAFTNFSQYMVLVKLSSDGTTVIWTQTTFYQTDPSYNHLAFDTDNNIIILGLRIDGPVGLIKYDPNGNLITNTSFGSFSSITSMVVDENDRLIFAGYDGTSPFIVRTTDSLNDPDNTFGTDGFVNFTVPGSSAATWNAIMINNNGKITVAGSGLLSSINTPYLMRVYGTEFVGQYNPSVAAGIPGNIDTNFGTDGSVDISALLSAVNDTLYVGAVPTAVLPMPDGSRYVACNVPHSFSFIIRLTNANILDTTYGSDGISSATNFGVSQMIMDGSGRLLLLGSYTDNAAGWVIRYVAGDSGDQDTTFNDGFGVFLVDVKLTQIIQQTLSRYVIAGADADSGDAMLWAFTDDGIADTTFNSQMTPGFYSTSSSHLATSLVADVYDRLIFGHYVAGLDGGDNVALTRLTASGELDLTFGDDDDGAYSGSIAGAITGASDAMQIRVVLDASGNIVVAAATDPNISIAAYENTTGANLVYSLVIDDTTITENATISDCIATADGNVLLSASLSDEGSMWIARITSSGLLDTTFNPSGSTYGTIRGVMQFTFRSDTPDHFVTAIAMYGDGTISIVGYEVGDGPTVYAFLATAYDTPYTTQELLCQDAKPIGTNDLTFGIQVPPANGFFFVATSDTERYDNQYAQAIALQNDQTIIVAIDGQVSLDGQSQIFVNAFDVDGLLDADFNTAITPGQAVVLTEFDNQYVRDMMTFTTPEGVHKAILAGYATNTALSCDNSLVMQYDLDIAALDVTFGGYNGDLLGLAVGTGFSQGFTIGRQSMGRIILGGFNSGNGVGFLQGYTPTGQLDQSFGAGGYCNQGTTGIYASLIDSQDRVVIAYNDGSNNLILARILSDGSGLDLTFGGEDTGTFFLDYGGTLTSNNSFRIAVDTSGTIFIASILSDGTEIAVYAFNPDTLDTKSSGFDASDFGGSLTGYTIGKLLINNEGRLVIIGADATSILVAQITTNGRGFLILDPHFNAADTPGYLRYTIDVRDTSYVQIISDALIHPDGRYISVGSNLPPVG